MSGMSDNYANPGATGQNVQPYESSIEVKKPLVHKYADRIFAKWQNPNIMKKLSSPPALTKSQEIHKNLEDSLLQNELARVREEFTKDAEMLVKERIIAVETEYKRKYELQLKGTTEEVERAYRIVGIQTALMSKIHEKNPELIPKILQEADISDEDIEFLINYRHD